MRCTSSAHLAAIFTCLLASVGLRADTGLDGCLYYIDGPAVKWSAEQWRQEVAFMRRAGFRHVILSGPAYAVLKAEPDPSLKAADEFLDASRGTGLRVYLSVWGHPRWYSRWNLDEELSTNRKAVQRLAEKYGRHPSFAGWYIPHEIYMVWDEQARYIRNLYVGLSSLCKEITPKAKVILSPFFILDHDGHVGDFRFAEPVEYEAFWYDLLRKTRIDIVAVQDSGEHLSFYTLDDRRPFLAAMQRACRRAGRTLWINVETGELHAESFADYEQKFGCKTHVNDAKTREHWRVVPPEKLQRKIGLAHEFGKTTITWGYYPYWDPLRGPEARRRYEAYLAVASRPQE